MRLGLGAKIGLIIGLLGGVIGGGVGLAAAFLDGGLIPGILVSLVLLFVFGMIWVMIIGPMISTSYIMKNGKDAEATIIETWDTGVTVNNSPQIGMLVEVRQPGRPPYQTKTKSVVSRLQVQYYQPGMVLGIKVHPTKPEKIAITSIGGGAGAGGYTGGSTMSKDEAERIVKEIDEFNKLIESYGQRASAIITSYNELGINVNGDNPAVKLGLKVIPDDGGSFNAETRGVILRSSIPKYQPGREINVKFDPSDNSKVVIVSSK
ncbi:MAG: hypothetical protein KDC42_05205 [Ignavibacteriae bacterium]|nr:hypothetical protein [Ignavibacteriota bacterium]